MFVAYRLKKYLTDFDKRCMYDNIDIKKVYRVV